MELTLQRRLHPLLGPGGLARVDAATIRKIKNVGDEPAVYLVTGGKDGYVGRDGRLPEGETSRVGRRAIRLGVREGARDVHPLAGVRALATAVVVLAALARRPPARPLPGAGCPVFPRSSQWNLRVDRLPVHAALGGDGAHASAPDAHRARRLRLRASGTAGRSASRS